MPRPSPARSNKLSAEEIRLQKEADALSRKEQELQQRLRRLPAQIEAKRSRDLELLKLRAKNSSPAISLKGMRGSRNSKSNGKTRPLAAREYQNARTKFIVLCLILASIGILLWRALP
ncbi:MAG: hypothetical protein ACOYM3_13805 [Terrimicrobiaceae bacterium]